MIVEIIIQSNVRALNKTFDYSVPEDLEDKIKLGSRVLVKFGNIKKLEEGFVVGFKETSEFKLKDIVEIDEQSNLEEDKLNLVEYISKQYFCNISESIKLMLPPGTINKDVDKRVKEKIINVIKVKKDKNEIIEDIQKGIIKTQKQILTLEALMLEDNITFGQLEEKIETSRSIINTLIKHEYLEIVEKNIQRDPFENKQIEQTQNLVLSEEQQNAFDKISDAIDDLMFFEFLIFGVTGSRENRNIFAINTKSTRRR